MTREKAIKEYVIPALEHTWNEKINKEVLEALEQETVSKESYDHEYFLRKEFEIKIAKLQHQLEEQAVKAEPVLDKVRAEIEQLPTTLIDVQRPHSIVERNVVELGAVTRIIDKYKAESEDKE